MPPLTPQVTLTIKLLDLQGSNVGSAANPAFIEIALYGYGPVMPRIPGTAMLGKVGPITQRIPYLGVTLSGVKLWGNDVIVPAGTGYVISILDDQLNVLQSGAYVFTGTVNADLSSLPQSFPNPGPSVQGAEVIVPGSATPAFNCGLVNGSVVEFFLTLTQDVISSTLLTNFAGQIVLFRIQQDATGGWGFTWPLNVQNPGVVSEDPTATTSQAFYVASNGNAYPIGPQTYS